MIIPYVLICPFGVFEVNTGRMTPPSPSCTTSMIPYWRVSVEVSILKNNHILLNLIIGRPQNAQLFISKHLFPGRYYAGRLVKRPGHQWICPTSASENG